MNSPFPRRALGGEGRPVRVCAAFRRPLGALCAVQPCLRRQVRARSQALLLHTQPCARKPQGCKRQPAWRRLQPEPHGLGRQLQQRDAEQRRRGHASTPGRAHSPSDEMWQAQSPPPSRCASGTRYSDARHASGALGSGAGDCPGTADTAATVRRSTAPRRAALPAPACEVSLHPLLGSPCEQESQLLAAAARAVAAASPPALWRRRGDALRPPPTTCYRAPSPPPPPPQHPAFCAPKQGVSTAPKLWPFGSEAPSGSDTDATAVASPAMAGRCASDTPVDPASCYAIASDARAQHAARACKRARDARELEDSPVADTPDASGRHSRPRLALPRCEALWPENSGPPFAWQAEPPCPPATLRLLGRQATGSP